MSKKRSTFSIIIISLIFVIIFALFINFFYNNYNSYENLDSNKTDDFTVCLKIVLNNTFGKIMPYPNGIYTLTTVSGSQTKSVDFSMNEPTLINATYDTDASNNILNRTIEIVPKNTNNTTTVFKDFITKQFEFDLSFSQVTYSLADPMLLSAMNLPSEYLNFIDSNNNLLITSMGSIYNNNKKFIGKVSQDMSDLSNKKTFIINLENKDNIDVNISKIKITLSHFVPLIANVPPPVDSRLTSQIPKLDPTTDYKLSLTLAPDATLPTSTTKPATTSKPATTTKPKK